MSAELDVRKKRQSLNVPLELARKIEKFFRKPKDTGVANAYIRALEEVSRDMTLTKADYRFIGEQVEANMKKRMALRQKKAVRK